MSIIQVMWTTLISRSLCYLTLSNYLVTIYIIDIICALNLLLDFYKYVNIWLNFYNGFYTFVYSFYSISFNDGISSFLLSTRFKLSNKYLAFAFNIK